MPHNKIFWLKTLINLDSRLVPITASYKVALTIADLDHSQQIHTSHLTEAIGYRRLDTSVI